MLLGRIAQTVVAMVLEPEVEPIFHDDSYEGSGAIDWSLPRAAAARSSSPREDR
jgi:hypothetical protein